MWISTEIPAVSRFSFGVGCILALVSGIWWTGGRVPSLGFRVPRRRLLGWRYGQAAVFGAVLALPAGAAVTSAGAYALLLAPGLGTASPVVAGLTMFALVRLQPVVAAWRANAPSHPASFRPWSAAMERCALAVCSVIAVAGPTDFSL